MWSSVAAKHMSPDRAAEFAYGAGQIDPIKALNPSLIYEADEGDCCNFMVLFYFKS